jgi:2-polyprenyl-6-methoxyphenol hydroxylase-like FAD-dependent oxidoreductase
VGSEPILYVNYNASPAGKTLFVQTRSVQYMPNIGNDSSEPSSDRVIICGAGIAGLTLAWWLDRTGWDVLVLEVAPELRDEGYPIELIGSGPDVAERMGILPQLKDEQYSFSEIENVNPRGVREFKFDFAQLSNDRTLALMRPELVRTLHAALSDDVEIRYELTIDSIQQDNSSVTVRLSDGTMERASFLVGADGTHSRVRELLFGDEDQFLRYLGYQTAAFMFEDEAVWQKLNGTSTHFTAPNRMAACYPLRDNTLAAYFVYRTPIQEQPDDICTTLRRTYREFEWGIPEILDHCEETDNIYYDQVAQVELPRWTKSRVTLLGDACQAVSLIAGKGASLAMGGAYVLAHELRQSGPVEEAFAKYQSRMQPKVEKEQASAREGAKWLVPPSQRFLTIQNLTFKAAQYPGGGHLIGRLIGPGTESIVK